MSRTLPAVFYRILGIGLGAIFLWAAYPKIQEPREFARIVYHYRILGPNQQVPPVLANTFAVTLPWVEAVLGVLLVSGLWRREAGLLAALLLVMFLMAVGWALAHHIDVEHCGCFSVSGEGRPAGVGLLVGDSLMLAAAVLLALPARAKGAPPSS